MTFIWKLNHKVVKINTPTDCDSVPAAMGWTVQQRLELKWRCRRAPGRLSSQPFDHSLVNLPPERDVQQLDKQLIFIHSTERTFCIWSVNTCTNKSIWEHIFSTAPERSVAQWASRVDPGPNRGMCFFEVLSRVMETSCPGRESVCVGMMKSSTCPHSSNPLHILIMANLQTYSRGHTHVHIDPPPSDGSANTPPQTYFS